MEQLEKSAVDGKSSLEGEEWKEVEAIRESVIRYSNDLNLPQEARDRLNVFLLKLRDVVQKNAKQQLCDVIKTTEVDGKTVGVGKGVILSPECVEQREGLPSDDSSMKDMVIVPDDYQFGVYESIKKSTWYKDTFHPSLWKRLKKGWRNLFSKMPRIYIRILKHA